MPTAYPSKANRVTQRDVEREQHEFDPTLLLVGIIVLLFAALAAFAFPFALLIDPADPTWLMGP